MAASQPALHALVDAVAARLGVRRPRRIRLVVNAEVVADPDSGGQVHGGSRSSNARLPMAADVTRDRAGDRTGGSQPR
jgi:hypothetical protein